ncbi:MAG: MotA/TolQ/ExbB proton channel family protein [Thermoguttaceae bacterium]|jgi:biopolymer transport protein ExbB
MIGTKRSFAIRAAWLLWAIGCCTGSVPAWAQSTPTGEPAIAVNAPTTAPVANTTAAPAAAPGRELISTTDLWRIIRDGGPLMLAIAACSFLLVTFVLERAISLRRGRVIPKPFVARFLQQLRDGELDRQEAMQLCDENTSPVAKVFAGAVRKWGRPSVELEQAIIDAGERVTNGLRKYLRLFYGIATVGPLLGLMGTVLGMIQTFNVIAAHDALGRAELLAGGIAKALLNTAGGLAVAIPASIFYVFFLSRVDKLIVDIDALAQEVINTISAEDLQERQSRPAKNRRNTTREAA